MDNGALDDALETRRRFGVFATRNDQGFQLGFDIGL